MVTRYEATGHDYDMLETHDGDWVEYADYYILEQKYNRLVELIKNMGLGNHGELD